MLGFGLKTKLIRKAGHALKFRFAVSACEYSRDTEVAIDQKLSHLSDRYLENLIVRWLWLEIKRATQEVQQGLGRFLRVVARHLLAQPALLSS